MTDHAKIKIPLIGCDIKRSDIEEENGFIDAYNEDINRPYLTDCIFLMYTGKLDTKEKLDRHVRFQRSPYLHDCDVVRINKKYYMLYTFVLTNDLKHMFTKSAESKKKLIDFWTLDDELIYNHCLCKTHLPEETVHSVPEVDYVPGPFDFLDE